MKKPIPLYGFMATFLTILALSFIGQTAHGQSAKPRVVVVEFKAPIHIEPAQGNRQGQTVIDGANGAACIIENRAHKSFDLEAGHKTMMAASDSESTAAWSQNSAGPISISCGGGEIVNTNGLEAPGAKAEWFPLDLSMIAREMQGKILIRKVRNSDYPRIELPDYIDGSRARARAAAEANRPWYQRLLRY